MYIIHTLTEAHFSKRENLSASKMSMKGQKQTLPRSRRAANNRDYYELTLNIRLEKLGSAYRAEVHCLVRRNNRMAEFASRDKEGKSRSPPQLNTLVSGYGTSAGRIHKIVL